MNRIDLKKIIMSDFDRHLGIFGNPMCRPRTKNFKKLPIRHIQKNYVYPLTEINLEKVFDENRGLKVLEENATAVHDYYRGGVQEKEEGENLLKEDKWEEARSPS